MVTVRLAECKGEIYRLQGQIIDTRNCAPLIASESARLTLRHFADRCGKLMMLFNYFWTHTHLPVDVQYISITACTVVQAVV